MLRKPVNKLLQRNNRMRAAVIKICTPFETLLTHSRTQPRTHLSTNSLTHPVTYPPINPPTNLPIHSLCTRSLAHSLTPHLFFSLPLPNICLFFYLPVLLFLVCVFVCVCVCRSVCDVVRCRCTLSRGQWSADSNVHPAWTSLRPDPSPHQIRS